MNENFTDYARNVLELADQEAHRLKHEYVGTDHLLLGLVKHGRGVAVDVLRRHNVDPAKIQHTIERIIPFGEDVATAEKYPLTPRARKAIEFAIEESRNLGNDYIGTGHILLGLLRDEENVACQILFAFGLKLDEVRREIIELASDGSEA